MGNTLFLMDEKKTGFIKPTLRSLALWCDPIGSDDTDSGGVVGVSVFMTDKADREAGSEIPAETLIRILGESALPRLSTIGLTGPPEWFGACVDMSDWYRTQKSLSLQPKPISNFDTKIRRKRMLSEWGRSLGQSYSRQSTLNLLFTALWFDSRLAPRPINILYGSSPAVPPSCAAVLTGSRWRGWMLVIVHELFNMLGAGDLLFISLTPVWCGDLAASCTAFTAHPPAVFSRHL